MSHPFVEHRKYPVADHDAESVQHYVVNIEDAYAEHHFHSFHGKTNGNRENERLSPCHVPIDEGSEKSHWHKRNDVPDQIHHRNQVIRRTVQQREDGLERREVAGTSMGAVELEPQMSNVDDGCRLEHHESDQDRAIGDESTCCDPTLSFDVHCQFLNNAGDSQSESHINDQMVNDQIAQVEPVPTLVPQFLDEKWNEHDPVRATRAVL
jgi:hypothetical protein